MMAALVVGYFASAVLPPDATADANLRELRELYVANRSTFTFGTFRFSQIRGQANSLDEACRGNIQGSTTGRGYLALDGRNVHYEVLYDEEELRRHQLRGYPGIRFGRKLALSQEIRTH